MLHLVFSAEALPRCLQAAGTQDHVFLAFAGAVVPAGQGAGEEAGAGDSAASTEASLHLLDRTGMDLFSRLIWQQRSVSWY